MTFVLPVPEIVDETVEVDEELELYPAVRVVLATAVIVSAPPVAVAV